MAYRTSIIIAAFGALALAAPAAAAEASDGFFVRNDSGMALTCISNRENSSRMERITLRPGEVWSGSSAKARRFRCAAPGRQARYRLMPGKRYALVADEMGKVTLAAAR
jgi:hypothetical protein